MDACRARPGHAERVAAVRRLHEADKRATAAKAAPTKASSTTTTATGLPDALTIFALRAEQRQQWAAAVAGSKPTYATDLPDPAQVYAARRVRT